MLKVTSVPREKIFFVGAGMIMISKTTVAGCPALVLTQNRDQSEDKVGTPIAQEDLDDEWFRDNSTVIAFASAEGAINFIERMNDTITDHGKAIGFVDEDGNVKEPGE